MPAGASGLSILSYGGMGDVTLLASFGEEPTLENADFRVDGEQDVFHPRDERVGGFQEG